MGAAASFHGQRPHRGRKKGRRKKEKKREERKEREDPLHGRMCLTTRDLSGRKEKGREEMGKEKREGERESYCFPPLCSSFSRGKKKKKEEGKKWEGKG